MNKFALIIITVILLAGTVSCNLNIPTVEFTSEPSELIATITQEVDETPIANLTVLEAADVIINALREKDMQTVAGFVHPEWGLRFTPYSFVRDDDLVFSVQVVPGLFSDETVYHWGLFDGSGFPIDLNFSDYYTQFIYSQDFANPQVIGLNTEIGIGNSINNIPEYYPDSHYVEYHFKGFDPQYEGMDWESLRLVFCEEEGIFYLIGIVHAQWTI